MKYAFLSRTQYKYCNIGSSVNSTENTLRFVETDLSQMSLVTSKSLSSATKQLPDNVNSTWGLFPACLKKDSTVPANCIRQKSPIVTSSTFCFYNFCDPIDRKTFNLKIVVDKSNREIKWFKNDILLAKTLLD